MKPESPITSPYLFAPLHELPPLLRIKPANTLADMKSQNLNQTHVSCPGQSISVKDERKLSNFMEIVNEETEGKNVLDSFGCEMALPLMKRIKNMPEGFVRNNISHELLDLNQLGISLAMKQHPKEPKKKRINSNQSRFSKDVRLLKENNISLTVFNIINGSMEEFNDLVTGQPFTEEQINICRDIRRRGKNKVIHLIKLGFTFFLYHSRLLLKTVGKERSLK